MGSEVARRARGLGMHVIAHDPYASAERAKAIGVELVSFEEALARSDFISLHMPLTPTTDKIFNDESFKKCKKGVRIINVARGGVIDEDALVRALDAGIVAQVWGLFCLHITYLCMSKMCLCINDLRESNTTRDSTYFYAILCGRCSVLQLFLPIDIGVQSACYRLLWMCLLWSHPRRAMHLSCMRTLL